MKLLLRAARVALGAAVFGAATPACYTAGSGTAPPTKSFYFPTGLAVSSGGSVLYAINSDFDLQWNGGTLQSYDLFQIRQDTAALIQANLSGSSTPPPGIPFLDPWQGQCPGYPPPPTNDRSGIGVPLGESCAPPVDSAQYVRDTAIVGAFATDLQVSSVAGTRLFAPVAGNATVTWADVGADDGTVTPPQGNDASSFSAFAFSCGKDSEGRCDGDHQAGNNANSYRNSRNATMPGEPFGLAQSEDGTVIAVTSETDTKTSLLTTGVKSPIWDQPTMQFVLDGLPNGGVGITSVPHDPLAVRRCEDWGDVQPCVRQAFLQTSRASAEVDLLRYYDDDGSCTAAPCGGAVGPQFRPFLEKERSWQITTNSSGADSRGVVVDPSPRIRCEATPGLTADQLTQCARLPASVFIANRTPATVVVGAIGQQLPGGLYDPDALSFVGNVSLNAGPSRLFLAPIVDQNGNYELKLFVVCYDSNEIFVYDPDDLHDPTGAAPELIIPTGSGPYALAFDPFSFSDAALGAAVPVDPRQPPALALKRYRFAYIASFTHSYVQVIDLDQTNLETYGNVVFTLGKPVPPKGQ
ncbi:MAG: YncE family protein [Polyangiaceae bacterium]